MQVHTLHFPQFREREITHMAGIQRSKLPVLRVGKTATEPVVSITDNGQIRFNKLAAVAFEGCTSVMLYDFNEKRELSIVGYTGKLPRGWTEADLFPLPVAKEGEADKKGCYINASSALRQLEYDYKASGSQLFKEGLTINKEKHFVKFVVPKGTLAPLPRQTRQRKAKEAPATQTAASKGNGAAQEADLDLTI